MSILKYYLIFGISNTLCKVFGIWYFKYYFSNICILVFQIPKCEYFAHLWMRQPVFEYVRQWYICQLHFRTVIYLPVTLSDDNYRSCAYHTSARSDVPFRMFNRFCTWPPSPQYVWCIQLYQVVSSVYAKIVDSQGSVSGSAWPVCEYEVPKVIESDQATTFTSQMTREILKSLGCYPGFKSPGHPKRPAWLKVSTKSARIC